MRKEERAKKERGRRLSILLIQQLSTQNPSHQALLWLTSPRSPHLLSRSRLPKCRRPCSLCTGAWLNSGQAAWGSALSRAGLVLSGKMQRLTQAGPAREATPSCCGSSFLLAISYPALSTTWPAKGGDTCRCSPGLKISCLLSGLNVMLELLGPWIRPLRPVCLLSFLPRVPLTDLKSLTDGNCGQLPKPSFQPVSSFQYKLMTLSLILPPTQPLGQAVYVLTACCPGCKGAQKEFFF